VGNDPTEVLTAKDLPKFFAVRSCTFLNGVFTMSFSSILQILKINPVDSGISKKSGQPWTRNTAECMLLAADGSVECVGRLSIPKDMVEALKVGVYTAGFALTVPTFGDQKGDITARLTSLTPVSPRATAPVQRAPVPA
jgi:hypothetical protein